MLSFIVPAHNEEDSIVACLHAIREAAASLGLDHEMIVVDDASTDTTAALAEGAGARVIPVAVRQISRARNAGALGARGDVLVFVDADTLVDAVVMRATLQALDAGAIGGGCAFRFDEPVPTWVKRTLPAALALGRRARLAAGCFLYCRREVFLRVGGFSEEVFAGEEIFLSRLLQKEGPFVILPEAVLTSGRKLRTYSGWAIFGMALRLLAAGRHGLRGREGLGLWYGPRRPDRRPDTGPDA
jgi:glycosyltransferase involved in cell wall biosynthesis